MEQLWLGDMLHIKDSVVDLLVWSSISKLNVMQLIVYILISFKKS